MTINDRPATAPEARIVPAARSRRRARGQIIVIFAAATVVFMGLSAIVIDVSWYLSSQVRMQRAADAAALAGVVLLPGNVPGAVSLARTEASRNGYTSGVNGMTVTPIQDPVSTRRMQVTITGPVGTYFARAIGVTSFNATVVAKAEYILPVPMGSPENYYGVFGMTRGLTESTTTTVTTQQPDVADSGSQVATTAPLGTWTASSGTGTPEAQLVAALGASNAANDPYGRTNTNGASHVLGGFNLAPVLSAGETVTGIRGLEVILDDAYLSASCGTSRIQVQVSEDGGANWTTPPTQNQSGALPIGSPNAADYTFGSPNNFTNWVLSGGRTWNSQNDFAPANFRVRLTAVKACSGGATAGIELGLDRLRVIAHYNTTKPTTTTTTTTTPIADKNLQGPGTACAGGVANCFVADGSNLNPRGFWGTLNTQGAENVDGDAHQPNYDTVGGTLSPNCNTITTVRACYDPHEYYNYAIEMAPGSTNGSVYIYDPNFCSVNVDKGTGDRWFSGTAGVSTVYEVWDTNNTLYDRGDDGIGSSGTTPNATSGALFKNMSWSDPTMGGAAVGGTVQPCERHTDNSYGDGRDYHNSWYLLYSGMSGGPSGRIYRITTSTDPASPSQQLGTDGENSFAIYASASGGTPKVYGLGAMQAFTPLKSGGGTESSEFYLAQIEKVHAGKTVQISLWDPGDTNPLTASIEILIPNVFGWQATPVTYSATVGTSNSNRADGPAPQPDCRTLSRTTPDPASISTFTSGTGSNTGKFNGCWLTINAAIPDNYNGDQNGWWKIKYTMTGSGVSNDVTTWKVQVLGNPVHLIVN